ncbi:HEPN domain-containing protein [Candidatus Kuenenbacteria bacterium]|nr:HEPN domain-containing protein [Candidatus Kuenenbacteria bacterium]
MNKEILKKWILFAEADLDAAQRLFKSPHPSQWTYLLILWHCHQTIEKALKMIMIKKEKEIFKIHDLLRLIELSEIKFSKEDFKFIKKLNKYYLKSRYPDLIYKPLSNPDKKITKNYLEKTIDLFLWLKK